MEVKTILMKSIPNIRIKKYKKRFDPTLTDSQ